MKGKNMFRRFPGTSWLTIITILIASLLIFAGCAGTPSASSPSAPADTAAAAAMASDTSSTTAAEYTASDTPLTAEQVYQRTAQSLPFVETELWSGSGVLIEGGWVLTNAHVVWPEREARVVFADGTELKNVPLARIDLVGDIALLGPVEVPQSPLSIAGNEDVSIGSDVFLVGYPMESDAFPQPTIVKGILSRIREWKSEDITFLQTDATAAPGQSGGILVDKYGSVIGLSGLSFTDQRFGMVASTADISRRIAGLLDDPDFSPIGTRVLPPPSIGNTQHNFWFSNYWEERTFFIHEAPGTELEIEAWSESDISMALYDSQGNELAYADDVLSGTETITAVKDAGTPWYLQVYPLVEKELEIEVSANVSIPQLQDPDDGRSVAVGEKIYANIDIMNEYDHFRLQLDEGDQVRITAESVMVDPFIEVDRGVGWQTIGDDDSGGGILGLNAEVVFEAPETGEYFVIIGDSSGYDIGGYVLSVSGTDDMSRRLEFMPVEEAAEDGTGTQSAPGPEESRESIAAWYRFFTEKPEGWIEDTEFFRMTAQYQDILFGGGKPIVGGYNPNIIVLSNPVPANTTLDAIADEAAGELTGHGIAVVSREYTTFLEKEALVLKMEMEMAAQRISITQMYMIFDRKFWILQVTGLEGSSDMKTAVSVLQTFRGFD
ncbi:MAG: serine protease, partial [Spirochaetota bacterium]|nr:serine protease [Spirochaetota bacterium]